MSMEPDTATLLSIIFDLKEALEFDSESCDFGPAYGLAMSRRKDALKRARSILTQTKFKRPPPKKVKGFRGDYHCLPMM